MSGSGVSVDLDKVEVVKSWERPKSVFEIRSFEIRTTRDSLRIYPG